MATVVLTDSTFPSLDVEEAILRPTGATIDRKSTRLNSSHLVISYAVFCLKKKKISRLAESLIRLINERAVYPLNNTPISVLVRTHELIVASQLTLFHDILHETSLYEHLP